MPLKIIDCFTFYNELDMLKFRLEELYDTVDFFVIVEATQTFSGNVKTLNYENNKHLFAKYETKIIYVIVDDMPGGGDAWPREKCQRCAIDRGLSHLDLNDDDIITVTDLDEIFSKHVLQNLKNIGLQNNVYKPSFDMYYYNLECKARLKWYHPKVLNYWTYKNICNRNCEQIRHWGHGIDIPGTSGWHFSYFGDVEFIKNKIQNFSHQEFNNNTYLNSDKIVEQIKKCDDLFFRDNKNTHWFEYCAIKDNKFLPDNYQMLLHFSDIVKK
jgi:beta-1,4-mannosyl-glycoprotein beta-1,4-N-acetylglucosaminyltransferase